MEVRSDWESLAPEILTLVLQRVQPGCGESGEGRRIVAVAGVCSSWRHLVLQLEAQSVSPRLSPQLIRFPAAIRREAAVDFPLRCLLKKKGNSFLLFQSFQNSEGVSEEYLVLGARKHYVPSCSSFELSTDIRSLAKERASSSSSSVASVKSNFSRSQFILGDHQDSALERSALCVKYSEEIVAGVRRRKLSCGFQPRFQRSDPAGVLLARASAATRRSLIRWSSFLKMKRQARRVHSTLLEEEEQNEQQQGQGRGVVGVLHEKKRNIVLEDRESAGAKSREEEIPGRLSLKSKTPEWNQERGCWSLDFQGRATMASIHNFQLISSNSSSSDTAATPERVVLQLGKVGKGEYIMDFCSPMSALQAFSICLTSFATSTGLEP